MGGETEWSPEEIHELPFPGLAMAGHLALGTGRGEDESERQERSPCGEEGSPEGGTLVSATFKSQNWKAETKL